MLFALWVVLSGQFVLEYLVLGAISAVVAMLLSERLFAGTHEGRFAPSPTNPVWYVRTAARFVVYLVWLAYQIVVSNLHVVYLVLHPRMPIEPSLVEFETSLVTEAAEVVLAHSITLTPGTVTVDASDGRLLVHCLSNRTRQGVASGATQRWVARVFGEPWRETVELTDVDVTERVSM